MRCLKVFVLLLIISFLYPACKKSSPQGIDKQPDAIDAVAGFPFDNEVRDFMRADVTHFPKPGGILFIGSSSIKKWDDLEHSFPGKPLIKRGLGGSTLSQWVSYYAPYMVYPYKPAKIFMYSGENDVSIGRTPEEVAADFKTFDEMIKRELPAAKLYFMSIKSSPSRIGFTDAFNQSNRLIKDYIATTTKTVYIDVATVLLDEKTMQPDSSLFKPDYLHLNAEGYKKWAEVLRPYLN